MSEPQVTFVALNEQQLKARELYLSGEKKIPTRIYSSLKTRNKTSKDMLKSALSCNDFQLSLV